MHCQAFTCLISERKCWRIDWRYVLSSFKGNTLTFFWKTSCISIWNYSQYCICCMYSCWWSWGCVATLPWHSDTENMGDCCHCSGHCLPIVPTVALLLQQASWQLPLGCILLFFHPFWRDVPLLLMSQWLYSLHLMMTVYYCFPECINYC